MYNILCLENIRRDQITGISLILMKSLEDLAESAASAGQFLQEKILCIRCGIQEMWDRSRQ